MTSARSAGPRMSVPPRLLSTFPTLNIVGSRFQLTGWLGSSTGAGRKPPSVPIWMNAGPRRGRIGHAAFPAVRRPGAGKQPAGARSGSQTQFVVTVQLHADVGATCDPS